MLIQSHYHNNYLLGKLYDTVRSLISRKESIHINSVNRYGINQFILFLFYKLYGFIEQLQHTWILIIETFKGI